MKEQAIIFIHGYLGHPRQFEGLLERLEGCGADCFNLLLPGHGAPLDRFVKTGMAEWERFSFSEIERIKKEYSTVVLVGHSMGGLLAISSALKQPEKITRIVAMALPLGIKLSPKGIGVLVKSVQKKKGEDSVQVASARRLRGVSGISIANSVRLLPSAIGLLRAMRRIKGQLSQLSVPLTAIYSELDEIVSEKALSALKAVDRAEILRFKACSHFMYLPEATDMIYLQIKAALNVQSAEITNV